MAMRSIWKGFLRFSMVTIPIKVFNAVDTGVTIHFNQLHKQDHGRVGYDKKCKSCGDALQPEDIVKGYEFAPDEYVLVTGDDLKALRLKSTRILEIEGFVPAREIDQTLFDTPYFVGPDGEVAGRGYALLAEALKKSRKMGVGKLVLRDREDMVLVGPHKGGLMIYKVRYPQVIREIGEVPCVGGQQVLSDELQLARSLIDAMATSLADIELKDTYQEAVREMIDAKIDGKEGIVMAEEVTPVIDIMAALRGSIAQAKAKESEPATGKKTTARKKTPAKKALASKKAPAKRQAA
jgi:DNA end-binding protein Ku